MTTDPINLLATEMDALVSAFFQNTTKPEFAQFLAEIGYDHYQNVKDDVLGQQLGAQKSLRQTVTLSFDSLDGAFRSLVEEPEKVIAADHQDLALAA